MPDSFLDELVRVVSRGEFDSYHESLQEALGALPWWCLFRRAEIKRQMDLTRLARRAYRAGFIACKAGRDCV